MAIDVSIRALTCTGSIEFWHFIICFWIWATFLWRIHNWATTIFLIMQLESTLSLLLLKFLDEEQIMNHRAKGNQSSHRLPWRSCSNFAFGEMVHCGKFINIDDWWYQFEPRCILVFWTRKGWSIPWEIISIFPHYVVSYTFHI